ncbi:MAG: hypothetical protein JW940_10035 [Polyangiaceae bacterium]|nr:hypothetical protein [Polyangiaceae bacterium]
MTPELRQLLSDRARSLQLRLNHGRVDPVTAATEALRVYTDAEDAVRVRWLSLELHGYSDRVDSTPLNVVLGVPPGDRLAAHVAAYRTQRGRAGSIEFRHFFVESLQDLVSASARVATSGGASLELEFAPTTGAPMHPRAGTFDGDVFGRVVAGFVAALHLQVGELVK